MKNKKIINVGILVYNGVYLLDFAGPLEVFYDAYSDDGEHLFNVYTVSTVSTEKEFTAHSDTKIQADYLIADCPKIDLLVIPGGDLDLVSNNSSLKDRIKGMISEAEKVMSVCTGAFILAELGLLDNLEITTWHGALDRLQALVPSASVKKGVRYTDNGKIVTTSGISAGIDGALHLVSKYYGKQVADDTAEYMDYEYWV